MRVVSLLFAALCASCAGVDSIPLPEHPRPDWERTEWMNLNGRWDFGFEKDAYDRTITVPFGWGSALSGVKESIAGSVPTGIPCGECPYRDSLRGVSLQGFPSS